MPSDVVYAPPPGTTGDITATNGDAAALGPTGDASAAPGSVTGGSGTALLGPDGTYSVTEISPSDVTVGNSVRPARPVTEPVYEPAPEAVAAPVETTEPVVADTAVASAEDSDSDNYLDVLELEVGLDPYNPDADGDGVADGDEVNIYFTDPWVWDTDGDGISDGEELFGILTNPLVWDTNGDGVGDGRDSRRLTRIGDSGRPQRDRSSPDHRDGSETAGMAARSAAMPPAADHHTGYGGEGGPRRR